MKPIKKYLFLGVLLCAFALQAQTVLRFDTSHGLPDNQVNRITQDPQGYIWVFTDRGIARFDGDRFKAVQADEERPDLIDPSAGLGHEQNYWFKDLEVSHYQNLRFHNTDSLALALHAKGYLIKNLNSGVLLEGEFPSRLQIDDASWNRFHWLDGRLQITGMNFVMALDEQLRPELPVQLDPEWGSHFSMIDRSGNLWCATKEGGIWMVPASVRFGHTLLGGQGVHRLLNWNNRTIALVDGHGFYQRQVQGLDFEAWFTTDSQVYDLVTDPESGYSYLLSGDWIRVIDRTGYLLQEINNKELGLQSLVHFEGQIVAYSPGGLQLLHPGTLKVLDIIPQFGIHDMQVAGNKLYLATANGLKQFWGGTIENVPLEDPMAYKAVLSLDVLDDQRLLVGTDGFGAYSTDLDSIYPIDASEFSKVKELKVQGSDLLMTTDIGLLRYRSTDGNWSLKQRYGRQEGLSSGAVNDGLIMGPELLIATNKGVLQMPTDDSQTGGPMALDLRKLSFNGAKGEPGSEFTYQNNNQLTVGIGIVDFRPQRGALDFEYRLLPAQENWLSGSGSSLTFNDLKPGNYILEVRQGQLKAETSWVILPLWWQSWWGRSLLIVLGLAVVIGILLVLRHYDLKRKLARLELQNKVTESELFALRSHMNPHFVSESLAAIQNSINGKDLPTAEAYLSKFSDLVRQFFDLSQQETVTVLEEAQLLRNYLEIEKLRFGSRLDYEVAVDPMLQNDRANIPTMLLHPVIENAVYHGLLNKAEGGKLQVSFQPKGMGMQVTITDDGVGFAQENDGIPVRGNGQVLEDRIYFLNKSGKWRVRKKMRPAYPNRRDQGSITQFQIESLS